MIYDSHHKVSSRIIVFQQKTQWQERNRLLTLVILSNIKQRYEKEKQHNQTLSAYISDSSSSVVTTFKQYVPAFLELL